MAGFPLMAFGAGLGQWAEARQRQQALDRQNHMLELTLSKYRDELAERGFKNEASDALSGIDISSILSGMKPAGPAPAEGGSSRAPFAPFSAGGLPASSSVKPPALDYGAPGEYGVGQGSPLPTSREGLLGTVDNRWLASNMPTGGLANGPAPSAGALPWTNTMAPASAEISGPGAGGANTPLTPNLPPARGLAPNAPQQMAQAQPGRQQASPVPGLNIPPPAQFDPGDIARAIRRADPKITPQGFRIAMEAAQKQLVAAYKQRFDLWQKMYDFNLRERGLAVQQGQLGETGRHNVATEGLTAAGQAETGRSNLATEADRAVQRAQEALRIAETNRANLAAEENRAGTLGETVTSNRMTEADRAEQRRLQAQGLGYEGRKTDLAEQAQGDLVSDRKEGRLIDRARVDLEKERIAIAKDVAEGRKTKVQGEQQLAVTQLRTLAERARDLLGAVESNPNLVGARGLADRIRGSVTEQAKLGVTHSQLSEFQSEINLLRAEVLKPMAINKYMTKGALEELKKLVPSDEALTSPTQAKAALRNLARHLEQKADQTEAVMGGVQKDLQGMSNEDLLKQLGVQPGAQ